MFENDLIFDEFTFYQDYPECDSLNGDPESIEKIASFTYDGFTIFGHGIYGVPVEFSHLSDKFNNSNMCLNHIFEDILSSNSMIMINTAPDLGCSAIKYGFKVDSGYPCRLQYFYTSDLMGRCKCTCLLRNLLRFHDSKFILRLDSAFFDAALDRVLVVMEAAPTGHLRQIVHSRGPIPSSIVSCILRKLLDALIWLQHDCGYVHNGLTTYNIFLDDFMQIRMGGLQLTQKNREVLNSSDVELGTVNVGDFTFVAPERLHRLESSYASDVWSLGIIAYELFSGKHMFDHIIQMMNHNANDGLSKFTTDIPFPMFTSKSADGFCIDLIKSPYFQGSSMTDQEREDSQYFIESCVKLLPEERPTMIDLRNSEFIRRHEKLGDEILKAWLDNPKILLPQTSYGKRKNLSARSSDADRTVKEKEQLCKNSLLWKDQRVMIDRLESILSLHIDCQGHWLCTCKASEHVEIRSRQLAIHPYRSG